MKMDEKYFEKMAQRIYYRKYSESEAKKILKQIALDAAEEQRHKCYSYCESNKSHTCFQCNKKLEIPHA